MSLSPTKSKRSIGKSLTPEENAKRMMQNRNNEKKRKSGEASRVFELRKRINSPASQATNQSVEEEEDLGEVDDQILNDTRSSLFPSASICELPNFCDCSSCSPRVDRHFLVSAVALVHPLLPHLAIDQALASVHLANQSNRGCKLEVRRQRRKLFMIPVTRWHRLESED